jgi:hypothetical protein
MNREEQHAALAESYRRLRIAARHVIESAEAVGTPEHPQAGIPAHVLRGLRRELQHQPAPSGLTFMSVT